MKKIFFALVGLISFCLIVLPGTESKGVEEGTRKWVFETGGSVVSSPAIGSDGTIYVGSNDGNLYAINAHGILKWKFLTGGAVHSRPAIGTDGTIFIGSFDHYVYAINPNGSLKWRFPTKGEVNGSPIIGQDGTIYIGSFDHYFYAINPNGSLKWKLQTEGELFSSPTIGSDGTIYFASWDHHLYAINGIPPGDPVSGTDAVDVKRKVRPLAEDRETAEIKDIRSENTPDGEERVILLINHFQPPRIFTLDGGRPRLVYDFFKTRLGLGIDHRIKVDGKLIRQVRIAFYRESKRVRVVMDLVSDRGYHAEEVFLKDKNLYTITLKPLKKPDKE